MYCINNRNSRDKLMISNKGHINKIIRTLVNLRLKEELMELPVGNLQVLMLKHQYKEWVVVRALLSLKMSRLFKIRSRNLDYK